MAEAWRRHSFEERPPSPVKLPFTSTSSSGSGNPPALDGSFLLQLLQKAPNATSSSSSQFILPHEALPHQDPAVAAVVSGFSFLPHSLLAHSQPTSFSPPSWAPPGFSAPDVRNPVFSGGQRFFPMDDGRLGFTPNDVNVRQGCPQPAHDEFFASDRTRDLSGKKVTGYRGQEEIASIRPPPGFGKAGFDGLSEFNSKVEGGSRSQIGSAGSNQQWRPHGRPEWRPAYNEEGRSEAALKMLQRLEPQNYRTERQDEKQRNVRILDNDARHRRLPNGYGVYKEKHSHSCYPDRPILNNCDFMGEKSSGESDKDLIDNQIDEQSFQILEKLDHVEIGQFSSRNEASNEDDLMGKQHAADPSDQQPPREAKEKRNVRGKKMSTPQLIFSFATGMNISVRKDELPDGAVIKFGQGFDNAEIKFGSVSVAMLKPEADREIEPVVEFNLRSTEEFPPLKRVLFEKNSPVTLKSAVRTIGTIPRTTVVASPPAAALASVNVKVAQVIDAPVVKENSIYAPISSVFELGSSSRAMPLTRIQRRNKSRKFAKIKKERAVEPACTALTPTVDEEVGLPETTPLLRGSRFHPLFATLGEESISKIAASPPHPFHREGQEKKRGNVTQMIQVRTVFERLARKENCSLADILKRMGCAVSHQIKVQILKEECLPPRTSSRFRLRERRTPVVPTTRAPPLARIPAKQRLGVNLPTDAATTTIVATTSSSKPMKRVPIMFRLGPKMSPTTQEELQPVAKGPREGHKLPTDASGPRVREHTTSHHINASRGPSSPKVSSPKGVVWQPKATGQMPVESIKAEDSTECDEFESLTASKPALEETVRRSPPVDLAIIKRDSIEATLEKLRADFKQLSRESESDDGEVLANYMEEVFAEVHVVETRASSFLREEQPPVEEIVVETFQQIIQQQDEQIDRLERKVEQMMAAIMTLQSQPQFHGTIPAEVHQPEVVHVADDKKKITSVNKEDQPKTDAAQGLIPEKDIKQMVEQQVKEALAQSKGGATILKGRPYPEEFDAVQYPKGYVPPLFKTFDDIGNPRQHVAHFRASCCNTGGSDALLFRQFVSSLSGVAFDWYAELPNSSVKTFAELENLFIQRFAGAQHHFTIGDLVVEKQKPDESLVDYILRWRNLSMKCELQLQEQHAIKILLKSIHGPIAFFLKGFTIKTFEKLLSKAAILQKEAKQLGFMEKFEKQKPVKAFEKMSGTVATVDKGKQPLQIWPEQPQQSYRPPPQQSQSYHPPQQYNQSYRPPKPYNQSYRSPQQYNQDYRPPQQYTQQPFQQGPYQGDRGRHPTISERLNKIYPFKDKAMDARKDFFRGYRVSSQRIRIRRRELQSRPDLDSFGPRFLSIFKSLLPSEAEILKQEQLLLWLRKLVKKEWPDAELHVYGSCANSFGVSNSDIDVCLAIKDHEISKLDILLRLADILKSSNLQNVQALTHARVPIVKMMDPATGISCDICVNNLLAIVNTKLLKDYAQIDPRLRQLAFIVKHWAKSRRVNETYQGTLSSYAYVLMCIHFLQTRKPAILPCLQGMETTCRVIVEDTDCAFFDKVEKLKNFGARNKESIAQLLWAFFHFWAYWHDYTNDVISVRTGRVISKQEKDWTRRIGNDRHLICIEDPFQVSHDLGRVVDKFSIKILREEFERAADIMQYNRNPTVALFEPYIPGSPPKLAPTEADEPI